MKPALLFPLAALAALATLPEKARMDEEAQRYDWQAGWETHWDAVASPPANGIPHKRFRACIEDKCTDKFEFRYVAGVDVTDEVERRRAEKREIEALSAIRAVPQSTKLAR